MIDRIFVCFRDGYGSHWHQYGEEKNPGDKKRCGYKGNSY